MSQITPADVSVIITTRDRPELALNALASALNQTRPPLEVIVVDDGSIPPFTLPEKPARVRVLRQQASGGVCAARNAGLAAARGRWVTFLDDDDELLPEMIATSLKAVEDSSLPAPVSVLTALEVVDEAGHRIAVRRPPTFPRGRDFFLETERNGHLQTQNSLVCERQVLVDIGGWDENLLASEHDDLFLRLNLVSSIEGAEEVAYRQRSEATDRRSADLLARARAMERTFDKHRPRFEGHPRRAARYLRVAGVTYLRAGRWWSAVRCTFLSVRMDPRSGEGWRWALAALGGPVLRRVWRGFRASR